VSERAEAPPRAGRGESAGEWQAGQGGEWRATGFLRRLRGGLERGSSLAQAVGDAAAELPRDARAGVTGVTRRLSGHYPEDEWGLDEEFAESARPLLDFLYERWWRIRVAGIEHVPAHGRALLVANHAGTFPWDGLMITTAIAREHPLPRYVRFLALDWTFELPYLSVAARKLGGVPGSPHNAVRLLEHDELVGIFPEGAAGAAKPFRERYRLQRFGRGGFVELALRTGAPIVPVAVVGSEETYPKLGQLPLAARLPGIPPLPITPTFPWLGALGLVPLPSRWRIRFCEPIETAGYGVDAAADRGLVFELSERVRDTIQETLYATLVERGAPFV
jgi:1-acyl-sn-glycerol-3-phosphate acyltransferase